MAKPISPACRSRPLRRTLATGAAVGLVVIGVITISRAASRPPPEPTDPAHAAGSSPLPVRRGAGLARPIRHEALALRGAPLRGHTGLRLLVADVPAPFVLDLDTGAVEPVTGVPRDGERGVTLLPVGRDALLVSHRFCDNCAPGAGTYLIRQGSTAATRIATSLAVAASRDGEGVWVLSTPHRGRCTIRELRLNGRPRGAARPMRCRTDLLAELSSGLLVDSIGARGESYSALVKPDGRVVRLGNAPAYPVGADLVLRGSERRFPLVLDDLRGGPDHRLSWPSRAGSLGEVTAHPNGRLAVVEFANAAAQTLDLWLLDTTGRRWRRLPDMPARVSPKAAHIQWTADGRMVLLASSAIAVWRPGEPRLAIRGIKPPKQPDRRFLIW